MGAETRREACDEFLQEVVGELFAHDLRVRGMGVTATVDGGVVHLRGSAEQADQLTRLRALIGRIAGVLAVWDRVRVAAREPVILDLGCGDQRQHPTNYGVDRRLTPSVAALADVSRPLPFRDAASTGSSRCTSWNT